jgi:hypothetical protein
MNDASTVQINFLLNEGSNIFAFDCTSPKENQSFTKEFRLDAIGGAFTRVPLSWTENRISSVILPPKKTSEKGWTSDDLIALGISF